MCSGERWDCRHDGDRCGRGCSGRGDISLPSRADRVVHSSLELLPAPTQTHAQLHDCPGSEQPKDVQDGEWLILWFGPPQKTPWFMVSPEAMFVSVICVTARGLLGVCGLCSHPGLISAQGSCGCLWSMLQPRVVLMSVALLSPEAMLKSLIHANVRRCLWPMMSPETT